MSLESVYLFRINKEHGRTPAPKQNGRYSEVYPRLNVLVSRIDGSSNDFNVTWTEQRAMPSVNLSGEIQAVNYFNHCEAFCRTDLDNKLIWYSGPRTSCSFVQDWIWQDNISLTAVSWRMDLRKILLRKDISELVVSKIRSIIIDNLAIERVPNATLSAQFVDLPACQELVDSPNSIIRSVTLISRKNTNAYIQLRASGIVRVSLSCGETWSDRIDFLEDFFTDLDLWS